MHIVLAGPFDTSEFRRLSGLTLVGAPSGHGGIPVTTLAAGLLRLGHKVHVVSLDPEVTLPVTVSDGGFDATFCPLRSAPRYRARVRALDLFEREITYLQNVISDIKPDIVHAHWTYEYAEAAIRTALPHIVTMHDLGWDCLWQYRDAYRIARLVMKYRTVPRIRNLTVVSPPMASMARYYGYFGRVVTIPNVVLAPAIMRNAIAGRSLVHPRIVTIGNRSRLKNVGKSVEAFLHLKRRFPLAELHLFGPNLGADYAPGVPDLVAHDSVGHDKIMAFLREEATLLIHPSRHDTFAMIVAEAKACGVPTIAGISSGGVAYVSGMNAGSRLVDIDDAVAIAEAASSILCDPKTYFECAIHAYDDFVERFAPDKTLLAYTAAYAAILKRECAVGRSATS